MPKWEAAIELTSRVVVTDLAIRACPKCEAMFLESMSKDRLDRHHRKQRRRAVVMAATMARKAERERPRFSILNH